MIQLDCRIRKSQTNSQCSYESDSTQILRLRNPTLITENCNEFLLATDTMEMTAFKFVFGPGNE